MYSSSFIVVEGIEVVATEVEYEYAEQVFSTAVKIICNKEVL